jgi:hypothetical protein
LHTLTASPHEPPTAEVMERGVRILSREVEEATAAAVVHGRSQPSQLPLTLRSCFSRLQKWQLKRSGMAQHPHLALNCLREALQRRGVVGSAVGLTLDSNSLLPLLRRVHEGSDAKHTASDAQTPLQMTSLPLGLLHLLVLRRLGVGCELVQTTGAKRELLLQLAGVATNGGEDGDRDRPGDPTVGPIRGLAASLTPFPLEPLGGPVPLTPSRWSADRVVKPPVPLPSTSTTSIRDDGSDVFFVSLTGAGWGTVWEEHEVVAPGLQLILGEQLPASARHAFAAPLTTVDVVAKLSAAWSAAFERSNDAKRATFWKLLLAAMGRLKQLEEETKQGDGAQYTSPSAQPIGEAIERLLRPLGSEQGSAGGRENNDGEGGDLRFGI